MSAALAKQRAADIASPPVAQMTLMDAVRLVAPLILERQEFGFTDPEIVALLEESLGFSITTGTLRVYLHRIRRENGPDGISGAWPFPSQTSVVEKDVAPDPGKGRGSTATADQVADAVDLVAAGSPPLSGELPHVPAGLTDQGEVAPRFNPLVDLDEDI